MNRLRSPGFATLPRLLIVDSGRTTLMRRARDIASTLYTHFVAVGQIALRKAPAGKLDHVEIARAVCWLRCTSPYDLPGLAPPLRGSRNIPRMSRHGGAQPPPCHRADRS